MKDIIDIINNINKRTSRDKNIDYDYIRSRLINDYILQYINLINEKYKNVTTSPVIVFDDGYHKEKTLIIGDYEYKLGGIHNIREIINNLIELLPQMEQRIDNILKIIDNNIIEMKKIVNEVFNELKNYEFIKDKSKLTYEIKKSEVNFAKIKFIIKYDDLTGCSIDVPLINKIELNKNDILEDCKMKIIQNFNNNIICAKNNDKAIQLYYDEYVFHINELIKYKLKKEAQDLLNISPGLSRELKRKIINFINNKNYY